MADIKWIKITVDMFDNRKIKHLRRLPDGNNIVLIWVMLLTMAGRCNAGGMIFLTENICYTPKMLADELGFEQSTVQLALQALEDLDMIRTDENGFLAVLGWEEHQNKDALDKIREQTRRRVAKCREKQAQIAQCNATCNATVTQCNATDIEEERDIDKDKEKEIYKEKEVTESTEHYDPRITSIDWDEVERVRKERAEEKARKERAWGNGYSGYSKPRNGDSKQRNR